MNTTNSMRNARVRWMVTGMVLGALGLAAALWIRGAVMADSAPEAGGSAMDMPGMDMGMDMPSMAMDTEPSGAEVVRMTPAQIREFGITFAMVEERPLEARIRTVGMVRADETHLVDVTTKFPGYADHLYADFTGKFVQAGSPLLDVYAPELVAAQEEVLLARGLQASIGTVAIPGVTTLPVDLEATARRRLGLWDITDDQIDALLSSGEATRTLSLRAPISGVILEKSVVTGGAFQAGQTLFRLADLSSVWIDVEIRESDAAMVVLGSRAIASLTAYPGETFPGAVDFVYPTVDERTRSVRARVVLRNPAGRLRPGMFAAVQVTTPRMIALSVPSDAVVWTGDRTLLFLEEEGGGIRPVDAELGATIGDHVVVLSGVTAGQRVVTSAQYLIDAEANIGAIMRSMMSMLGAGDMSGMDMPGMEGGGMEGMVMPGDSGSAGPNPAGR
jgi:hypothetical protein